MTKEFKNKGFTHQNFQRKISGGFTLAEMLFWLALIAFLVGGLIYKNTKEIQKNPPTNNQNGGILGDLKSETESKQKIIEEN